MEKGRAGGKRGGWGENINFDKLIVSKVLDGRQ